ncbi:MAG: SusC/RagA family TonB-linked outer membrane protein, partial [Bacteroidales bacterium]|nr:SusC/RagA family TonB-linked outer membrane protein [Bacteroidales bacterium]
GRAVINITLAEEIIGLEEVIAIGYGTKKKATVTGSIATAEGAELQKTPATNLANTLTGRMTGVVVNTRGSMPGAESIYINIRGKGSWRGGSPLIIIDGIANRYGFEKLNPNDIESISVLKDASAAIYGSRAANGVILVTTKRGKEGKPTIEYTSDFGLTQPTRIPEMCRSWQYATYYTEAERSGYMWTDEEIEKFKQGTDVNLYPNYDIKDYMLQSVASQNMNTLSLRGGTDAIQYYVSGRYLYQDSYAKDGIDDFNSYSIRSNIDAQVNKNFTLALDLSGKRDDVRRASGSGYTQAYGAGSDIDVGWFEEYFTDPTKPIYYENGFPAPIYGNNIVERIKGEAGEKNNGSATINSQITARWELPFITKGLFLEGTGAYDFINVRTKEFSKSYDLYSYDASTGEYSNMNVNPVMNRSVYDYYYNSHQYTLNGKFGYERTFNDHSISTFVAYEQYSINTEWINATRSTFLSDQIPFQFAGDANTQKNDGSGSEYAYRNAFGRIAYNYKEKYLVDLTLRRDESLKFPKDIRVGWFPGISVGWRLSEEPFIKDNMEAIDNLKLRASYGQMGSDNVGAYQYM